MVEFDLVDIGAWWYFYFLERNSLTYNESSTCTLFYKNTNTRIKEIILSI